MSAFEPQTTASRRRSATPRARVRVGSLLLLACLAPAGPCFSGEPVGPARNLLFVSLDTVRRDHLSTYGYARKTSPRLDALAEGAVVFDNAFAQESNTNPSHASMFTGVYPAVHGSRINGVVLADDQITLAQVLKRAGFDTGGFVSGAAMKSKATGLQRGFEVYEESFEGFRRAGAETVALATDWLSRRADDRRYFLFVHLYDAHGPYLPPAPYERTFRSEKPGPSLQRVPPYQREPFRDQPGEWELSGYVDRYDGCIRYVDEVLGTLLDHIDVKDTAVVVAADHGETLGERFWSLDHGGQAFEEQFRIPLVIRAPGVSARRSDALVETVDLLPTLLELLGVARPDARPVEGSSLLPLMRGETTTHRDRSFSSSRAVSARHLDRGYRLDPGRSIVAVRAEGWKLIRYPGADKDYVELYRLASDPGERRNVAAEHPAEVARYQDYLNAWLATEASDRSLPEIDPEIRKQLESLGYVDR